MPLIPLHDTTPRFLIARPWITWGLIVACAAIYFLQASSGPQGFGRLVYGLGVIPAVLTGQAELPPQLHMTDPWLTLITSQFLHGGFLHLAGNMLYLWVFGDNVEDSMGHGRFLVFYLVCGVAAGLSQVIVDPSSTTPTIGASGAISGVLGAYLILHPRSKVLVPIGFIPLYLPAWLVLIFWFGLQFYSVATGGEGNVAWWAHIGGFIAGMALIFVFRYKAVPLFGLKDPPGGITLRRGAVWRPKSDPRPHNPHKGPWD